MHRLAIEDVGPEDQVVLGRRNGLTLPCRPVRRVHLGRDPVSRGVVFAQEKRSLLVVGLHDLRGAEGGGDDAREAGPRAQLEHALIVKFANSDELVRERDRCWPQHDSVRQTHFGPEKTLLVVTAQDRARMADLPRMPAEREVVLLERNLTDRRIERRHVTQHTSATAAIAPNTKPAMTSRGVCRPYATRPIPMTSAATPNAAPPACETGQTIPAASIANAE
jgi:hypothetical protein